MSKIIKRQGSLVDLLRHLLSENPAYIPMFVIVHPKWNSSIEVFNALDFILSFTRVSEYPFLADFLIRWINYYWLAQEKHQPIMNYITQILDKFEKADLPEPSNRIRLTILRKHVTKMSSPACVTRRPSTLFGFDPDTMSYATRVASQITLLESRYFRNIVIEEILMMEWRKDHGQDLAEDSISQMVLHTNKITAWLTKLFLREVLPENRLRMLLFYAKLIHYATELKNYHLLMEIYGCLDSYLVTRILSQMKVPKKTQMQIDWLRDLFKPEKNYKHYRSKLQKEREKGSTFLPFLGLLTSDVYFIDEGNSDYNRHKDINIEKMELLADHLQNFKSYQASAAYVIEEDETLIRFFDTLPLIPTQKLEELSHRLKPFPC
jgi:hypothetical protein